MILVTGCTGFIGSHTVHALVEQGFEVRCLARGTRDIDRLPKKRMTFAVGDVTDPDTLLEASEGIEAIIHLVGIIREKGEATFERIHVDGTRNVIEAAKAQGVRRLIYQSALGAREDGISRYETTKWQAEELVRGSGLQWIITRPSVIVGKWGEFAGILKDLVCKTPLVPVIGSGGYKLQPMYVGDLTEAFVRMLRDDSLWGKTYEFGGPEQLTFNRMLEITKEVFGVRKPLIHLPLSLMKPVIRTMQSITHRFPITSDQLAMLAEDNVTDHNALTDVFGIEPTPFCEAMMRAFGME